MSFDELYEQDVIAAVSPQCFIEMVGTIRV